MSEDAEARIYEFAGFRLDAGRRRLFRAETGELLEVQPKAVELLVALVENAGRDLTKGELLETVWPDTTVEESNLSQTVFVLRKALGDDRRNPRFIVTLPNRGYRFIAPLRAAADTGAEKQFAPAGADVPPVGQPFPFRPVIAAAVILILLGGAAYLYRRSSAPPNLTEIRSVAVLPFQTLGGDGADDYLGPGIAEVLASKLSALPTVVVRPPKNQIGPSAETPDPRRVGAELNVEAVVTGQLQRSGDRLRVTVQFVRTSDGATLWADVFDDRLTNIFAVQDSISGRIAENLGRRLTGEDRARLAKRPTDDTGAYELFLKGRFLWNQRTPESLLRALDQFEQATARDPNFALAYAGLADCYVLLGEYSAKPPTESFEKARLAAARAIELDPQLGEPVASLAYVAAFYDWDYPAADELFRRSLALNPNYPTGHQWYGDFLADMGRFAEAHAQFAEAMRLDPTSPIIINAEAHALFNERRYDEVIETDRRCLALDPNFGMCYTNLGFAYERKGMDAEAAAALARAMALIGEPDDSVTEVREAFRRGGLRGFWEKRLEQIQTRPYLKNFPPVSVAVVYAEIGDREKALEWLERGYVQRDRYLVSAKNYPWFDFLHGEPRFQALLRRINL
ncbi:MAG: winged helix-turn-helix domain-containing protein [Acidobacteria bacterium]|nr:winged helix-turn-helix domain-containing protein [Acidobacteriota bacterium]